MLPPNLKGPVAKAGPSVFKMKTVYFDTNAYSHIYKQHYAITDADSKN
jgi:hypothetical protein